MATTPKRFRNRTPSRPEFQQHQVARLVPVVARAVLQLAVDRGVAPESLCRGLGFTHGELMGSTLLLSYEQTRTLILRAQEQLGDPALGLAMGQRITPVSWGPTGVAMTTFETFGEAILFGLAHQLSAGAMVEHRLLEGEGELLHEVSPHVADPPVERFLVDSALVSVVAVSRQFMQSERGPLRVELAYPQPAEHLAYRRFFGCPVKFDAAVSRMAFDPAFLSFRVPGHDPASAGVLRAQLALVMPQAGVRNDLVESLSNRLRLQAEQVPRPREMAQLVNVSERTLRRRLSQQDTSFRTLRDEARFEKARELLATPTRTIAEVATALGFSDARAFRRAFKRWSGQLPTQFRGGEASPAPGS